MARPGLAWAVRGALPETVPGGGHVRGAQHGGVGRVAGAHGGVDRDAPEERDGVRGRDGDGCRHDARQRTQHHDGRKPALPPAVQPSRDAQLLRRVRHGCAAGAQPAPARPAAHAYAQPRLPHRGRWRGAALLPALPQDVGAVYCRPHLPGRHVLSVPLQLTCPKAGLALAPSLGARSGLLS